MFYSRSTLQFSACLVESTTVFPSILSISLSCPNLCSYLLYKMSQDFLDIQLSIMISEVGWILKGGRGHVIVIVS